MGKKEKKIALISKYIHNVSNYSSYEYGRIPSDVLRGAMLKYIGVVDKNDILGIVDVSWNNSGNKGIAFTDKKIYYNNGLGLWENPKSISYMEINTHNQIPNDLLDKSRYNIEVLKELIGKLVEIHCETIYDKLEQGIDFTNKVLNALDTVVTIFDSSDKT